MNSSTQFYASRKEFCSLLLEMGERFDFELFAYDDPAWPPKLSSCPPYTVDFSDFIQQDAVSVVVQPGLRHSSVNDVYRNAEDALICSFSSIKHGVLAESQLFTRTGAGRHPFKLVQAKLKRQMRRGAWVEGPQCREYYSNQLYSIDAERMFKEGVRLSQNINSDAPFLNLALDPPSSDIGRCIEDLIQGKWVVRDSRRLHAKRLGF